MIVYTSFGVCWYFSFFVFLLVVGATVLPQYYGVPWSVYPANIIQQGAATNAQQRRPLTPSSVATETANNLAAAAASVQQSPYVIPAYYDQNGSIVMRGIGNGPTMRLVSPAPVLVNPSNPGKYKQFSILNHLHLVQAISLIFSHSLSLSHARTHTHTHTHTHTEVTSPPGVDPNFLTHYC